MPMIQGQVKFANNLTRADEYMGKRRYKLVLTPNKEGIKQLKSQGLDEKFKQIDNDITITFNRKEDFGLVETVDSKLNAVDPKKIGNGSVVNVIYSFKDWDGVTAVYLDKLQVVDLVEYEGAASEDFAEVDEGFVSDEEQFSVAN
jgi:hypothetical protein